MIIIIGFGKDYQDLKRQREKARLVRLASVRPRRMPLERLAEWLSGR